VARFLASRPCIEEVEGFLGGIKEQARDASLTTAGTSFSGITDEVLGPVQEYLDRLMKGRDVPAESFMERAYVYERGKPPVRKRVSHAQP
jgi:hypothetical protein